MIVKKYGGASVDSTGKIKNIALQIQKDLKQNSPMIIVVSAMGATTNQLIQLAKQISSRPSLRELDMLLTTGERISASLLTMALLDLKIKATSLTGSQAGIITNESHANAYILDIRPNRLEALLKSHQVIVLAGFQGVSSDKKEITTLGRGGSDTTAIAIAARMGASSCHILKEVSSIFTADPKLVTSAKSLQNISHTQAAEMTFWGAKVLHHRSTQLAAQFNLPIFVGPAHIEAEGTWIRNNHSNLKETDMYEKPHFIAINSHAKVLHIESLKTSLSESLSFLKNSDASLQVIEPQILWYENSPSKLDLFLTGPDESLESVIYNLDSYSYLTLKQTYSTVSVLCHPTTSLELQHKLVEALAPLENHVLKVMVSGQSVNLLVKQDYREALITHLHEVFFAAKNSSL